MDGASAFVGIWLWRDPYGQIYLVDHTGTHKVTKPGTSAGAATDGPELTMHVSDVPVEYDPGA